MTGADDGLRTGVFDPDDPGVIADPYPLYDRLRSGDPVHWNPKGFWFLSRYEDVAAALRDPRLSNRPAPFAMLHARNRDRFVASDVAANLVAFKDQPEHTAVRRPLAMAFGARLKGMTEAFREIAQDVTGALGRGRARDAVADFAAPCALRTTARMIGFAERDLARIAGWSSDFFLMFHAIPDADTAARLNASVQAFRAYVEQEMAAPRQDGLLADLAARTPAQDRRAVADNLMLLTADGIENVRAGLACAIAAILARPDVLRRARSDPGARDAAIAEALRLESPGQYQGRITLAPVEIGGRTIRARSIVLLGYGAANRDPAVFRDPARFDIDRAGPRPMTFGMGPHACLGIAMVRAQAAAAIDALLDCPVRLSRPDAALRWSARTGHRWLADLPLEIGA